MHSTRTTEDATKEAEVAQQQDRNHGASAEMAGSEKGQEETLQELQQQQQGGYRRQGPSKVSCVS
jgi:hypothetical protein